MKELMLEVLCYEPFGKFLPEEKKYIHEILFEIYPQPQSMTRDLFWGFYRYVQSGNFKNTSWLQNWKNTYFSKGRRAYYPLLFKKICFYIIVRGKFTDKEFMGLLNLPVNRIRKWGISPQFRKYAEENTYSAIKSFRSGAKKPYIVSIVKKLYYEAGRQVSESVTLKKLPRFVDVFAGTASVAASMGASKEFPRPVVNDYDPVMVCFVWAFVYCQRELRKKIAEFHNDLMGKDFESTEWSYSESDYEERIDPKSLLESPKIWDDSKTLRSLMEFQGYEEETIERGRMYAQRHKEFVIRTRSSYIDVKNLLGSLDSLKYLGSLKPSDSSEPSEPSDSSEPRVRKYLRETINFNESPKMMDEDLLEDVLDYAQAIFYFYSFAPSGKSGNVYHETIVDANSYFKYLSRLKVKKLEDFRDKDLAVKASAMMDLRLEADSLILKADGDFSRHLRGAEFCCKDFKKILPKKKLPRKKLPDDPSNRIYYLDSPYFLTVGYDVDFFDDKHKDMLDILRNADFCWIFSMQFNPSDRCKCTRSRDEAERKKQDRHIIKDYGAYYRGFYSPFQLDAGVYDIPRDNSTQVPSDLYAILFDLNEVGKKRPQMKTREMLVVNFDCLRAIPLHDTAVVLPFKLFLQCADAVCADAKRANVKCANARRADVKCANAKCPYADRAYQEIVQKAIDWRKNNIANNYTGKDSV